MAIIIRDVTLTDSPYSPLIPETKEGKCYRYEMLCDHGLTRLYDDSIIGFLDYLIPNYSGMNIKEKLVSRISHAVRIQDKMQSQLNDFFKKSYKTLEEENILEKKITLQPILESWSCQTPLVLIDAFYFPYNSTPRPYSEIKNIAIPSNLWWLRPSEGEMEYLMSLHEVSFIDLNIDKTDYTD